MPVARWLASIFAAEHAAPWTRLDDTEWALGGVRAQSYWLWALLFLALILRVTVAVLFPSIYHADETFQYWEQGYRLVFGAGIIPWEYQVGIRSWIMPGFIASLMWVVDQFGGGPAIWRFVVQFAFSAASLSVVATAFLWARRLSGAGAGILAGLVTSVWFEFVYFSVRPLTEIVAASALFPAAYLLCAVPKATLRARMFGGALLALAFILRFHIAPAVLIIAIAHIMKYPNRAWWPAALSAILALLASGLLDWVTLGAPFQSIWLNFTINIFEGRAADFGRSPFYWYLLLFANVWPGIAVIMLALFLLGARRAPLLFLVSIVILISHSAIAHKEYRFLYPALPFALTLITVALADIFAHLTRSLDQRTRRRAFLLLGLGLVLTSANLAAHDGYRPNFFTIVQKIKIFEAAGKIDQMCGLAIGGDYWAATPGMVRTGRPVPLYWLREYEKNNAPSEAYNVLIYNVKVWRPDPQYQLVRCEGETCLAQRIGTCTPHPEAEINTVLAANYQ